MKQKYLVERVMNAIFFVCGLTAIACVVLISVYMIIAGVPAIGKIGFIDFLFGTKWASTAAEPSYGIPSDGFCIHGGSTARSARF